MEQGVERIVECVPNFSDGRNRTTVRALVHAVEEQLVHPQRKLTRAATDDSNVRAVFELYQELTAARPASAPAPGV